MMNTSLLQKSGLATLQVAQILAGLEPGDRIPTVTELSEQCEMARGNIQIALNNLKQNHVIRLVSFIRNGSCRSGNCGRKNFLASTAFVIPRCTKSCPSIGLIPNSWANIWLVSACSGVMG